MATQPMLQLQLITLLGQKMDEEVYEVILPTTIGEISVFPGHEPLVSLAKAGVIAVRRQKTDPDTALEYFATSGGIIEIDPGRVRVLVDEADHGDDIIEAENKKILEQRINKLLDSLTSSQREAIVLRYVHELGYDEIASLLDMTPKASRKLISRAMDRMRNQELLLLLILFCKF